MTNSIERWSNTAPIKLLSEEETIREYYKGLKQLSKITHDFDHDIYIIEDILQEIGIAKAEEAAICKDTECPWYYVEEDEYQYYLDLEDSYWEELFDYYEVDDEYDYYSSMFEEYDLRVYNEEMDAYWLKYWNEYLESKAEGVWDNINE